MFFGKNYIFLFDFIPVWNFYAFESIHLPNQMHMHFGMKGMISYTSDEKITFKVKTLAN